MITQSIAGGPNSVQRVGGFGKCLLEETTSNCDLKKSRNEPLKRTGGERTCRGSHVNHDADERGSCSGLMGLRAWVLETWRRVDPGEIGRERSRYTGPCKLCKGFCIVSEPPGGAVGNF